MKKCALVFLASGILVFSQQCNLSAAKSKASIIRSYLEKADAYSNDNQPFSAINVLRDATRNNADHPLVRVQLSILYYGLGLIEEAIIEAEYAVEMDPDSEKNKFDLAKFNLINQQYDKAEKLFIDILRHNPGFTLGFYYLGLTYCRQKQYDLAWLCLQRAKLLGHQGTYLEEKLGRLTIPPKTHFASSYEKDHLFRFIMVPSKKEAEAILTDIKQGKLFDILVIEQKNRKKQVASGLIMLSELKASIAKSIKDLQPFAEPVIIYTDPDFRIIQRIAPFSIQHWKKTAASTIKDKKQDKRPQIATTSAVPLSSLIKQPEKIVAVTKTTLRQKEAKKVQKLKALDAILNWKNAWQTQNAEDYFSMYSDRFKPAKRLSRKTWKKKRLENLTRPNLIKIELENLVVDMKSDSRATATFLLNYTSDRFSDTVNKKMVLVQEGNDWKILKEEIVTP